MCALDTHRTSRVPPLRTSTGYRNLSIYVQVRVNSTGIGGHKLYITLISDIIVALLEFSEEGEIY